MKLRTPTAGTPVIRLVAVSLALVSVIGGCCLWSRDHEDVGSTHVSVVSVTRWDDYRDALQPSFALSEADALKQVLPDTLQLEQSVLDALKVTARLKLAPTDVLPAGFDEGQSGASPPELPEGDSPRAEEAEDVIDSSKLGLEPHLRYLAATALYQEVKLLNRYVRDAALRDGFQGYVVRLQVSSMPFRRETPVDAYMNLSFFMERVGLPAQKRDQVIPWSPVREPFQIMDSEPTNLVSPIVRDSLEGLISELEELDPRFTSSSRQRVEYALEDWRRERDALGESRAGEALLIRIEAALDSLRESDVAQKLQKELTPTAFTMQTLQQQELKPESENVLASILSLEAAIDRLRALLEEAKTPIVLPLLVTDQVEAAIASRRQERLRELVLAISAAYAGIGGEGSLQSVNQAIESSLGRDFNSLLTVGRLTDNTLRVRIGARYSGNAESHYSAVPQNHYVTVLVLVPKEAVDERDATAYVTSRTLFVDVETGEPIASSIAERDGAALEHIAASHVLFDETRIEQVVGGGQEFPALKADSVRRLARLAQHNDYDAFLLAVIESMENANDRPSKSELLTGEYGALARSLWGELVALRTGSQFDQTEIPLRHYPAVERKIPTQNLLLLDNGKKTVARMGNVQGLDPELVRASWTFEFAADQEITFAARSARLEGGHQLLLEFPSASQGRMAPEPGNVSVWLAGGENLETLPAKWLEVSAVAVPGLEVQRTQQSVTKGTAKLTLHFKLTKEALELAKKASDAKDPEFEKLVKGGEHVFLVQIKGAASVKSPNGLLRESKASAPLHHAIVGGGVETLELDGVSDEKLTLRFIAPSGFVAPKPIEFSVKAK